MAQPPGQTSQNQRAGRNGASPGAPAAGGSLADMVQPDAAVSFRESFPAATQIKIGVLMLLMLSAHAWQLRLLVRQWLSGPDWAHGFIIPLFSAYLVYSRREELLAVGRRTGFWSYGGLAVIVLSLLAQPICVYPIRNYWLMQICMVGVLFGLVLYLGGAPVIRLTWLPVVFLLFAMPISPGLYTRISLPLQEFAAKGAMAVLRVVGVDIRSVGSSLTLVSRSGFVRNLTVAEACNGMKLLMAFVALGVAMAYLDYRPIWQRLILVAAAIPIAIICNVIRVATTCWMYYIDKEELGRDFMHYFTGVLMLIPAFLMLWLLGWVLRNLFVEPSAKEGPFVKAEEAE